MYKDNIRTAKYQLLTIGVRIYMKYVASVVSFGELPSNDGYGFTINHVKVLMKDGSAHEYDWIYVNKNGEPSIYSFRGVAKNYNFIPASGGQQE